MHAPLDEAERPREATDHGLFARADRALVFGNRCIMTVASLALIAACGILSYSVAVRSIFHSATYWQDEAAVFLIVGATFSTCAFVQQHRGHIGIEAFAGLLPPAFNRIRLVVVDAASFAFCAFFAWKS